MTLSTIRERINKASSKWSMQGTIKTVAWYTIKFSWKAGLFWTMGLEELDRFWKYYRN